MAKPEIELSLIYFLKRYLRSRLAGLLLAYALSNLAIYLLLLIVVLLFNIPLLVFHLLLFASLSALPLFLFFGLERVTVRRIVRSVDEHCQVASYLQAPSRDHRVFMEERVESLLERRKGNRIFAFRFSIPHLYLIGVSVFLLVALQVISFLTLRELTGSFSAQSLKSRLLERRAAEAPAEPYAEEELAPGGSPATEEPGRIAPGQQVEQRAGRDAGGETLEDLLADEASLSEAPASALDASPQEEGSVPAFERNESGPGIEPPGAATQMEFARNPEGEAEQGEEIGREGGGAEAGSGDAGRSYRESPVVDYTALRAEIAAQGGEELSATGTLAERQRQAYLDALFTDFLFRASLRRDFDPLFDSIRERYLELLDERF